MSYYLAYHRTDCRHLGGPVYSSGHLHEATCKKELAYLVRTHDAVDKVDAATAHKWVKDGGIHSTGLYTERDWNGRVRIRKSKGE